MSKSKPITVEHDGTTITYDERRNVWAFTLRGRDRSSESLAKAREAIDKPVKEKKSETFKPFEAWFGGGWSSNDFRKVTVTGIAERTYRYASRNEVWIRDKNARSKQDADSVYPVSEHNDPVIEALLELRKQRETIENKINTARRKLKAYAVPTGPDDDTATA